MSTILKALEKDNNAPQTFVIEKRSTSNGKFLLVLGSVTIILLLTVIALLLFKPRVLSQIKPVTQPALVTNVVDPVPEKQETYYAAASNNIADRVIHSAAFDYQMEGASVNDFDTQTGLVSEVSFETQPLPISENKPSQEKQKWISPDKPSQEKQKWISPDKPSQEEQKFISPDKPTQAAPAVVEDKSYPNAPLENVSLELQERFARAVELEKSEDNKGTNVLSDVQTKVATTDITLMPVQFQFQVPLMRYDSHMYSTEKNDRWIRINGVDLRIGDRVGNVELLDILPQQSLFRLGQQKFTLESLKDWQG